RRKRKKKKKQVKKKEQICARLNGPKISDDDDSKYYPNLCKYLIVASGRAAVFILQARSQRVIKAWDHAVGVICVHEAGGKTGQEVNLILLHIKNIDPAGGVLVTNGNIHNQILEMISSNSIVV
ncbi:Inositol monophosphatase-like - like 3, partial [Theobroma cacao]